MLDADVRIAIERATRRLHELSQAGGFEEMLAVTDKVRNQVPAFVAWNTQWQAVALCGLGRLDDAVQRLSDAVSAGHAWQPRLLLADAGLAPLRTRHDFQALLRRSESVLRGREVELHVEVAVVRAPHSRSRSPLLLLLGGGAQEPAEFASPWLSSQVDALVVVVVGTQLRTTDVPFRYLDDVERSRQDLEIALNRLNTPFDWRRVVIGGFSRGGYVALALTLDRRPVAAAGYICCNPGFDDLSFLRGRRPRPDGQPLGWIVVGEMDPLRADGVQAHRILADAGYSVELKEATGVGHRPAQLLAGVVVECLIRVSVRSSA